MSEFKASKDETLYNFYDEQYGYLIFGNMPIHMIEAYIKLDEKNCTYEEAKAICAEAMSHENKKIEIRLTLDKSLDSDF